MLNLECFVNGHKLSSLNTFSNSNKKYKIKNIELLALPGVIEAKSHGEWSSRGLSRGTPDPYRQACLDMRGRGGPACLQAHQAPPWLCPTFTLSGVASLSLSVLAFVLLI